jgi:hypothetical protein
MADVLRAVDGPLGLIVGDMPDGSLRVLKRNRKEPGFTLTSYADTARSRVLETRTILDRVEAVNAFSAAIGLGETIA